MTITRIPMGGPSQSLNAPAEPTHGSTSQGLAQSSVPSPALSIENPGRPSTQILPAKPPSRPDMVNAVPHKHSPIFDRSMETQKCSNGSKERHSGQFTKKPSPQSDSSFERRSGPKIHLEHRLTAYLMVLTDPRYLLTILAWTGGPDRLYIWRRCGMCPF